MLKESQCAFCNDPYIMKRANQTYCSHYCKDAASYSRALLKIDASPYKIFERDGFRCFYCQKSSVEDRVKLVLDHVMPRTYGGDNGIGNLVSCCEGCNNQKRHFLPDAETLKRVQDEIARRNAGQKFRRESKRPI